MEIPFANAIDQKLPLISPQRAAKEKLLRYAGAEIDKLLIKDKLDYTIFDDGVVKIRFIIANAKYKYYFKKPRYSDIWYWLKELSKRKSLKMDAGA